MLSVSVTILWVLVVLSLLWLLGLALLRSTSYWTAIAVVLMLVLVLSHMILLGL